jgi:hypothetical protein
MNKKNVYKYAILVSFALIWAWPVFAQTNTGFGAACNIAKQSCDNVIRHFNVTFSPDWYKLPFQEDICLRLTGKSRVELAEGFAAKQDRFLVYGCSATNNNTLNLKGILLSDALNATGGDLGKTLFLFSNLLNDKEANVILPKYGLIIDVQKQMMTVNSI